MEKPWTFTKKLKSKDALPSSRQEICKNWAHTSVLRNHGSERLPSLVDFLHEDLTRWQLQRKQALAATNLCFRLKTLKAIHVKQTQLTLEASTGQEPPGHNDNTAFHVQHRCHIRELALASCTLRALGRLTQTKQGLDSC